jgi:hypothetical protein
MGRWKGAQSLVIYMYCTTLVAEVAQYTQSPSNRNALTVSEATSKLYLPGSDERSRQKLNFRLAAPAVATRHDGPKRYERFHEVRHAAIR